MKELHEAQQNELEAKQKTEQSHTLMASEAPRLQLGGNEEEDVDQLASKLDKVKIRKPRNSWISFVVEQVAAELEKNPGL